MKKIMALLLAAAMCLCLAACGDGEPNTPDQGGTSGGAQNSYADHPCFQFLYGEWEYTGNYADNYPYTKLTVNRDGTCLVDGAAGTYCVSERSTEGRLHIDICVGGQATGAAEICLWAGKYIFGVPDIAVNPGDNWKHHTAVIPDENDIVLTEENWQDYFDLITEATYSEDLFGDVERLVLRQYLVVKEEYAQKILATDAVYQLEQTSGEFPIALNAAEKTYTLGDMTRQYDPYTDEPQKLWREYETNRYQITLTTNRINAAENADPESTSHKSVSLITSLEDIRMLRIQGNIYLVNE